MKNFALIVAGGRGIRMGSEVPKQFLLLRGKPVLMHTVELFHKTLPEIHITLVLPKNEQQVWKRLCDQYDFSVPHEIVTGGETRFESVKNGLSTLPGSGLVAIHDGVRPNVSTDLIIRCLDSANKFGSGVPVVAITQSLRRKVNSESMPVDRSGLMAVQTPQCFQLRKIKPAFELPYEPDFTDDATVFEKFGQRLYFVEGEAMNIKITSPDDLRLAEALMLMEK